MQSSFLKPLSIIFENNTSTHDTSLALSLGKILSFYGLPCGHESLNNITIDTFSEYEKTLGLMLCLIPVSSANQVNSLPILVQFEGDKKFEVLIGNRCAVNKSYKQHNIVYAWQCCPINFPKIVSYTSLLTIIARNFKKDILIVTTIGMIAACCTLFLSLLSGYLFSHLHQINGSTYAILFSIFTILSLGASSFTYINDTYAKLFNIKIYFSLLPSVWNHILNLPLNITKHYLSGELVQRVMDYEFSILILIKNSLMILFESFALIFLLFYMLFCDPKLTVAYICIYVFGIAIKLSLLPSSLSYVSKQLAEQGRLSSFLNEAFLQIHKIRSANCENNVYQSWMHQLIKIKGNAEQVVKIDVIGNLIDHILPTLLLLSCYGVFYFNPDKINSVLFLQFMMCATQFSTLFERLALNATSLLHFKPALKQMEFLLNTSVESFPNKKANINFTGAITLKNVTYKEPQNNKRILNKVSLNIEAGKFIAIIGKSGAGKSSLFKLILGLEKISSGKIFADTEDINNINLHNYRKHFGVVLQTTTLFSGSIFSNISINSNLTHEEAWRLAEIVGLDKEINQMPMKMHTYISDNSGESISGGQKQKILIARALSSKPKVLLLDEATSALDNISQAHIFNNLKKMNITRVVIAHRYSTVLGADFVYVLNEGRL